MINYINNIVRFIGLILLQVLILDNINFGGYVNPYLYVYFILLLPFEISGWLLLISSFLLGLGVDVFSGTPGMHAFASVLMAFFRPAVVKSIGSKREYEAGMSPCIKDLGFQWFFVYSLILILIHHLALFYLEVFRFSGFFNTFLRAIYSVIFTLVLVILTQFLFYKPSGK
ncbi:MAG: rod shape-determining protein MreD [Bacteroidales bacterium]